MQRWLMAVSKRCRLGGITVTCQHRNDPAHMGPGTDARALNAATCSVQLNVAPAECACGMLDRSSGPLRIALYQYDWSSISTMIRSDLIATCPGDQPSPPPLGKSSACATPCNTASLRDLAACAASSRRAASNPGSSSGSSSSSSSSSAGSPEWHGHHNQYARHLRAPGSGEQQAAAASPLTD